MSYNVDGSAIQEVKDLVLAASPVLEADVKGGEKFLIRQPDGSVRFFEVPVKPSNHTVFDLASLKAMADRDHEPNSEQLVTGVFVSDKEIQVVTEQEFSRVTNTLALPLHPAFQHLLNWQRITNITQKDLVRLLRTELREHVDPTVIAAFSRLRFSSSDDTLSEVRPQSKALDVSIRQKVATDKGEDAPETIKFHVPVFDIREARGDQYEVEVYVEYDYEKKCFQLLAVHSDLRTARENAVAEIMDDLKAHAADRFPVLYGQPQ